MNKDDSWAVALGCSAHQCSHKALHELQQVACKLLQRLRGGALLVPL
jgi:hypothetical protein